MNQVQLVAHKAHFMPIPIEIVGSSWLEVEGKQKRSLKGTASVSVLKWQAISMLPFTPTSKHSKPFKGLCEQALGRTGAQVTYSLEM